MNSSLKYQSPDYISTLESMKVENTFVVADFDKTITSADSLPMIQIVRENWDLWEYTYRAGILRKTYYPIELSPDIDLVTKKIKVNEWWELYSELLLESKIHIWAIERARDSWYIKLREWFKDIIDLLDKLNIPLVIVSATLWWDFIKGYLENLWLDLSNIHIITNEFKWDSDWFIDWYTTPLIHAYNKDEIDLNFFPKIQEKIIGRVNIILMWDSLWDTLITNSFSHNQVIKIWFLNPWSENLSNHFREVYDKVLVYREDLYQVYEEFKLIK